MKNAMIGFIILILGCGFPNYTFVCKTDQDCALNEYCIIDFDYQRTCHTICNGDNSLCSTNEYCQVDANLSGEPVAVCFE